jgi:hypothetical protein
MEPEGSLLCLKGTTMYPSAAPHQSSPGPLSYFLKFNFNIIIPCIPPSFKQSRLLVFPKPQPCICLSCPPACCMSHLILLDLFTKLYPGSAYHEGPHYAVSSSPLNLTLSGPRPSIFLSTLFSKTLSFYYCLTDKVSHPYKTKQFCIF